jgi:hypothetical protein
MRKFELWRSTKQEGKALVLERVGQDHAAFRIFRLAATEDNFFTSIDDINQLLNDELEFIERLDVDDEDLEDSAQG